MSARFWGWLFENPDFADAIDRAVQTAAPQMPQYPEARSRIRTGRMAASWIAEANGSQIRVASEGVAYTVFNEVGTGRMSAQPMLKPSIPTFQTILANDIATEIAKLG